MPIVSQDGRTYTFRISRGFRFSNGAPVGAGGLRVHDLLLTSIYRSLPACRSSGTSSPLRRRRDTLTIQAGATGPRPALARFRDALLSVVCRGDGDRRARDRHDSERRPYYVATRARAVRDLKPNSYYSGAATER